MPKRSPIQVLTAFRAAWLWWSPTVQLPVRSMELHIFYYFVFGSRRLELQYHRHKTWSRFCFFGIKNSTLIEAIVQQSLFRFECLDFKSAFILLISNCSLQLQTTILRPALGLIWKKKHYHRNNDSANTDDFFRNNRSKSCFLIIVNVGWRFRASDTKNELGFVSSNLKNFSLIKTIIQHTQAILLFHSIKNYLSLLNNEPNKITAFLDRMK